MIVETVRFVRIHVVAIILTILRIECLDSHAAFFHEDICDVSKTYLGVTAVKELWCVAHGDAYVTSKLIICV
jgi:hypothetical protein